MYLSYSGYKTYHSCPRSYWHRYVGKTKLAVPDNRVNMLFGSAVGTIFEAFYNDKVWKSANVSQALDTLVEPTVQRIMQEEMRRGGMFNWSDPKANYHSVDSMFDAVRKAVPNGLAIIKLHRLLGPVAEAEMKLDSEVRGHILGGRADFVIERTSPHGDLVILDGKGSKHREKYVDGMQLRWYAMLYRYRFGKVPDRLGFVFWRYPPGKSLDWEPFTPEGLTDLSINAIETIVRIEEGQASLRGEAPSGNGAFAAVPEKQHCNLCSFMPVCPEGAVVTKSPMALAPGGVAVEDVFLDVDL
jgi:hypothetical protein